MLLKLLLVTLFSSSVIALPLQDDPKHLKVVELEKYRSPQLYLFGGNDGAISDANKKFLSSASHHNSSSSEWELATDMSTARSQFCGAVVGTKIYLFGGHNNVDYEIRTSEVYDCESNTYSQFQSLPGSLYGCAAAVLDGHIYVTGGYHSGIISNVIRYNIQTNRRENVSSMHTPRREHQLVELGGRLYAIGGYQTNTVEAYNATTDRWVTVTSTKNQHYYFGATAHEGKLYVLSKNGFEVYSPATDEWDTLTPPNNYEGSSLVSMNGKLWALGGGNPSDNIASKSVQSYKKKKKKWSEHSEMNIARKFHLSFVVNH